MNRKYGLERPPGAEPGTVHLDCPCGHGPTFNLRDLTIRFVRCACGAEYDRLGWVITPSPYEPATRILR